MKESTQKKLSRNRPPRVQITYDLEVNGDVKSTELPLVVGILADLAGKTTLPQPRDRKFVDIDRDNFDAVMKSIRPTLNLEEVPNRLDRAAAGSHLPVELHFERLEDLRPESLIQQIPELRKLFEARQRLSDLSAKIDGNQKGEAKIQDDIVKKAVTDLEPIKKEIEGRERIKQEELKKTKPVEAKPEDVKPTSKETDKKGEPSV